MDAYSVIWALEVLYLNSSAALFSFLDFSHHME